MSTGANVHAVAFSTDSQMTAGSTSSALIGRNAKKLGHVTMLSDGGVALVLTRADKVDEFPEYDPSRHSGEIGVVAEPKFVVVPYWK